MAELTQEKFEAKLEILRNKLVAEGISEDKLNQAEFCEIYEDENNTCSDEWLDLYEDIARNC